MLNRANLFALLEEHIRACTKEDAILGVMLVRIQRFREFNIIFGYETGDHLISAAQALMERVLRPADVVVRVGDYQFAVLLPGIRNANHAVLAANRVIRAFQEPLSAGDRQVLVTVAVGVSICPEHGATPEVLCRRADVALSEALRGVERFAIYSAPGEHVEIPYSELREAIVNNRLELYLQPLWDLRRQRVIGAEALSRWHSPNLGWVSPGVFVPFAEQTGLIAQLTRWSLNSALRHCSAARRRGVHLPLSVNLSPRVFAERGIVEQILGAIRIWDVAPEMLVAEVTETALMEDPILSARVLERLRAEGVRIAIDDFGTGYSSFTYLKQFPASTLKIDKSFVGDMLADVKAAQLVRSMIDLAHNLEITVVAEGVEDAATMERLGEMGCDYVQGYHVARPAPAERFVASMIEAQAQDGS